MSKGLPDLTTATAILTSLWATAILAILTDLPLALGRGLCYISAVHTEEEIDYAIAVATEVLGEMS